MSFFIRQPKPLLMFSLSYFLYRNIILPAPCKIKQCPKVLHSIQIVVLLEIEELVLSYGDIQKEIVWQNLRSYDNTIAQKSQLRNHIYL